VNYFDSTTMNLFESTVSVDLSGKMCREKGTSWIEIFFRLEMRFVGVLEFLATLIFDWISKVNVDFLYIFLEPFIDNFNVAFGI
jgi:hypothetical protein